MTCIWKLHFVQTNLCLTRPSWSKNFDPLSRQNQKHYDVFLYNSLRPTLRNSFDYVQNDERDQVRLRVEFLFGYSVSKPNLLTGYFVLTVVYILQNEEKSLMYVALLFSEIVESFFFKQLTYHKSLQCNLLKTNWLRRTVRGTQLFRLHAGWWKGSGNRLKVE